ncbi:hypothetical protein RhiirA5_386813, partial [Rhizophagus irregularis]
LIVMHSFVVAENSCTIQKRMWVGSVGFGCGLVLVRVWVWVSVGWECGVLGWECGFAWCGCFGWECGFGCICLIVMHVFVVAIIDGEILYHSKTLVYSESVLSKISMINAYIFVSKMPRQCNKRHKNVREAPYVVNSHRMVYLHYWRLQNQKAMILQCTVVKKIICTVYL